MEYSVEQEIKAEHTALQDEIALIGQRYAVCVVYYIDYIGSDEVCKHHIIERAEMKQLCERKPRHQYETIKDVTHKGRVYSVI